jgi:transcription termination/antitermination protein NusA
MNGPELLRIVDSMHREKNIPKEVIFDGIEAALLLAARKHYDVDEEAADEFTMRIDRANGQITAKRGEMDIDPTVLGRIAAQSAKQVMIQKIREAECNSVHDEFVTQKGVLVTGAVQRLEGGSALVSLGKTEAFLPKSEMIAGESLHVGQRVKAVILEVKKVGNRVRIVLSRTHPDFVKRLFEQEIPEIADRTISIKAIAREAGYRTKIAASSIDSKVDAVGACVGVRGSRIKNIVDELNGERIDIVRWNESIQVMITNALQPAQIAEVMLYQRTGRAIVLVNEDQLSLAIGRRGQNVRLASKLVGWDIEIMTQDELGDSLEKAEGWFRMIPEITEEMVDGFIEEGLLSFDDIAFLEPEEVQEITGVDEEKAFDMIEFAEAAAETVEDARRTKPQPEAAPAPAPEAAPAEVPAGEMVTTLETATEEPEPVLAGVTETEAAPENPATSAEEPAPVTQDEKA